MRRGTPRRVVVNGIVVNPILAFPGGEQARSWHRTLHNLYHQLVCLLLHPRQQANGWQGKRRDFSDANVVYQYPVSGHGDCV